MDAIQNLTNEELIKHLNECTAQIFAERDTNTRFAIRDLYRELAYELKKRGYTVPRSLENGISYTDVAIDFYQGV